MRLKWIASTAAGAVLLGGGGLGAMALWSGPPRDDALELAPRDSVFYASLFLDPSLNQKRALHALLSKLPGYATPDEAVRSIEGLLDRALVGSGLDYANDVKPWLGNQIAGFGVVRPGASEIAGAILLSAEDTGAAMESVKSSPQLSSATLVATSHRGVAYEVDRARDVAFGSLEGFLVLGNEAGFKAAVDARAGASLADSRSFDRVTSALSRDRLALFYYDPSAALRGLPTGAGLLTGTAVPGSTGRQPGAAILFARDDAIVLEASAASPTDPAAARVVRAAARQGPVPTLPAESTLALGIPELGRLLGGVVDGLGRMGMGGAGLGPGGGATPSGRSLIEEQFRAYTGLDLERDLLSWMGDLGLSVQGRSVLALQGGVVIESRDPGASGRAVESVRRLLIREGGPVKPLNATNLPGFALGDESARHDINVVAAPDRVVIAYGDRATLELLEPSRTLADSALFREAERSLGDGYNVSGFVDMDAVVSLAESLGATSNDAYVREVEPLLDHVSYAVFGARLKGDEIVQRAIIGIE